MQSGTAGSTRKTNCEGILLIRVALVIVWLPEVEERVMVPLGKSSITNWTAYGPSVLLVLGW